MRKELEKELGKRESIIHAQNVFIKKPIEIYLNRETNKYVLGYEIKSYSNHRLIYKISKNLVNKIENPVKFERSVDINIQEDYRLSIKSTDTFWKIRTKNITLRSVPTRYENLQNLYGIIQKYGYTWY
jgi:hypothetical protein